MNEAARRILRHHWVLITLLTLIGAGVPLLLLQLRTETYEATARISIGVTDTRDAQEAQALADTALALATSPEVIAQALNEAGARRDQALVLEQVSVEPVGSSGILELSVTDEDPELAAKVANALASEVVRLREQAVLGGTLELMSQIEAQIQQLNERIATTTDPLVVSQSTSLRASLEAQRGQLAQELAGAVRPRVIDDSTTLGTPVADALPSRLAVGALLGLVLGVALAATMETWRPTLSRGSLARYLGVPLLGHLARPGRRGVASQNRWLAEYVKLAAEAAGVRSVRLVPVGPSTDVTPLAWSLGEGAGNGLQVSPLLLDGDGPPQERLGSGHTPQDTGIVVVAPDVVRAPELASLERHVSLTHRPVLGVITYSGKVPYTAAPQAQAGAAHHGAGPHGTAAVDRGPASTAASLS